MDRPNEIKSAVHLITANKRLSHRLYLISAACLCIVVVCLLLYQHHQQSKLKESARQAAAQQHENQVYNSLKISEKTVRANGQYSNAADAWIAFASQKSTDNSYRAKALQNAAMLYLSGGDMKRAIDAFKKAASVTGLTYIEAMGIATAAQRNGDKVTAIYYFQQALRLMPRDMTNYNGKKKLITDDISKLKQSK